MSVKLEFKHGLPALAAAFLGIALGITSLYFYTAGLFIKPLQAEFGWSRTAISSVTLAGALSLAAISPFIGALADRCGVKLVAGLSLLGMSVGFYLLSDVSSNFIHFLLLCIFLHLVGAGTSPVVFTRLVNQWFTQSRGLALGIALAGTGVTGSLAPRLVAGFIDKNGWQSAYQLLALIVLILTPIVILLIRKSDSHAKPALPDISTPSAVKNSGSTFKEALRTNIFWLLSLLFFCVALAVGGIVIHLVPMLTDAGLPLNSAATIAGALGASVIIGRILTGFLLDRFFAPRIAIVLFTITAAGCIALALGGADFAIIAAISIGFSMGAEVDFISYMVARYFGLKEYGKIYGILYAIFMLGMSFSPILIGFIYDTQQSYFYALWAAAGCLLFASAAASQLPPFPITTQKQPTNITQELLT